jgi:subtilisin family serine protease
VNKTSFVYVIVFLLIATVLAPVTPPAHASIVIRGFENPNAQISIFVQSDHRLSPDEVGLLKNYGTVSTVAGPIAVLQTSTVNLQAIGSLHFVTRIENSHSLSIALDKSVVDIGAPQVWNNVKDPAGRNVTGAGVVVGFVDTGIDTSHPDFSYPNGTTKILYVWDQTSSGRPPDGFNYGFECTSADIENRLCPEKDTFGHGTHVAGIAASSGVATGNYTGVAPGASIIFVKSGWSVCNDSSWTFSTSGILDGVSYIVNKASKLGMRAVISLSLGGNIGAHDGTDPFEIGLNAIVESGTPVAVAAGNEARDNDHIRGQLEQGKSVTFQIESQGSTTDIQVDVWYSPEDHIDATLTTPDGKSYPVPTVAGGMLSVYGNVTTTTGSLNTGRELYFEVNSTTNLPAKDWNVTLRANQINSQGLWDAWTDAITCSYPGTYFLPGDGYAIDSHDTIGIPGTAKDVVTVGAYITKTTWTGMNGNTYGRKDLQPGGIASFSSLGATRDGRIKPDVVAPGALIVSARSSEIPSQPSDPDPFHRVLAGTSMATPHVAGTIALMLQYDPRLQATEIPQILRTSARLDQNTGVLSNGSPIWGFGKVDARAATGLFRLTLTSFGIPASLGVPIRVDGKENHEIYSDFWTDLYFVKGTIHTISVETQIQGEPGARYELGDGSLTVTSNTLKILNYSAQYFLTVNSRFEPTSGSGWYNSNTTVTVSAPQHVRAAGLLGYLGAEYALAYWVTADGKVASDSITIQGPTTVSAVYSLTLPLEAFAIILAVLGVFLVGIVVVVRKRTS